MRAVARSLAALPRPVATLAAVAWMALIYFLSSGPRDLLPSGWPFQTLNNAAHGPVYGVLALLASRVAKPRAGAAWIGLAVAVVYGATDEWHQSLVPGRSASVAVHALNDPGTVLTLPATPAGTSCAIKSKSRFV